MSEIYNELKSRGLIKQFTTGEDKLKELLDGPSLKVYAGFDPTKNSLHVGHLIPIMILSHLQKAGHVPICVLGGGTAMIGDPSGRDSMREMLTEAKINENITGIKKQLSHFIDFSAENALLMNNYDWLGLENYISFIRDIGPHFTVNRMLTADCFKIRMEKGLSFLEFNYMILQAYDYYILFKKYGCTLQIGGDDQWSNILAGIDLIRRKNGAEVFGMTNPLLTRSDGKKMGKTEGGAVWLDPEMTSPYDYYQFWRNTSDDDVVRFLKIYTFVPLETISQYENLSGQELNIAKELLAFEAVKILHGESEALKADESAKKLFGQGSLTDAPSINLALENVIGAQLVDLCVIAGVFKTKSEVRRMIAQGGISLNGEKVTDAKKLITEGDIHKGSLVIKKGKKSFYKIEI